MLRRLLLNAKNMGKLIVVVETDTDIIYTDYDFPVSGDLRDMGILYKFFRDTEVIVINRGSYDSTVSGGGLYRKTGSTVEVGSHLGRVDLYTGSVKDWSLTANIQPFTGSKYDI